MELIETMDDLIHCPECPQYPIRSLYDYTNHRQVYHDKSMLCFVTDCRSRTFKNIKQHLMEAHPSLADELRKKRNQSNCSDTNDPNVCDSTTDHIYTGQELESDEDLDVLVVPEDESITLQYHIIHDDEQDPTKTVEKLVSEVLVVKEEKLLNDVQFISIVKCIMEQIQSVKNDGNFDFILEKLKHSLSTSWNMKTFIKNHFPYSQPIRQVVSGNEVWRVPIKSIIEQILASESNVGQLMSAQLYKPGSDGNITCFRDTQCFKDESQKLFNEIRHRDDVLIIFGEMYADGFDITNPIGPFKGASHVTGVYLNCSDLKRKDKL